MTTLIIYAHPNIDGHCSTILANVQLQLKDKKEKYELIDLYKINFDPVLHEEELYTVGKKKNDKQIIEFQNKITKSDKLIFIYPIWWNAPPAILKGFIDRVFSSKFAFTYEKKYGLILPVGLLKGKKAIVFTTSGSNNFVFNCMFKARGSKTIAKDSLRFCGIKTKAFHFGKALNLNDETKIKLSKLTKKGMNWLY